MKECYNDMMNEHGRRPGNIIILKVETLIGMNLSSYRTIPACVCGVGGEKIIIISGA